jgi:hypothetical protein
MKRVGKIISLVIFIGLLNAQSLFGMRSQEPVLTQALGLLKGKLLTLAGALSGSVSFIEPINAGWYFTYKKVLDKEKDLLLFPMIGVYHAGSPGWNFRWDMLNMVMSDKMLPDYIVKQISSFRPGLERLFGVVITGVVCDRKQDQPLTTEKYNMSFHKFLRFYYKKDVVCVPKGTRKTYYSCRAYVPMGIFGANGVERSSGRGAMAFNSFLPQNVFCHDGALSPSETAHIIVNNGLQFSTMWSIARTPDSFGYTENLLPENRDKKLIMIIYHLLINDPDVAGDFYQKCIDRKERFKGIIDSINSYNHKGVNKKSKNILQTFVSELRKMVNKAR